jgi:hypothetical protein
MPPFSHLVRSVCWDEVATHPRDGKLHPRVICIHCQKIWFSSARIRIIEHLKICKELPQHLWETYQPGRLQSYNNESNPPPLKKRRQDSSWIDRMEDSEAEVLDELLAEFFYGAGIALSLVSSLFI